MLALHVSRRRFESDQLHQAFMPDDLRVHPRTGSILQTTVFYAGLAPIAHECAKAMRKTLVDGAWKLDTALSSREV